MARSIFLMTLLVGGALGCHADPFDSLRLKWRSQLAGVEHIDGSIPEVRDQLATIEEQARRAWGTMEKSPDSPGLWSDLVSPTSSSQISAAWRRLRSMARNPLIGHRLPWAFDRWYHFSN